MSATPRPGPREVLRQTSRTFALSITALPRRMREPVEVAYLLARAADTVADTGIVPREVRRDVLSDFRRTLREPGASPSAGGAEEISRWAAGAPEDPEAGATARAERELLAGMGGLLERYRRLGPDDRTDVRDVVDRLVETMVGELAWLEAAPEMAVLPDGEALTRYTEGIAGCVGAFWTRLVARHRARRLPEPLVHALEVEGRRYGRGLQLVNVLRDLPRDLRDGKCLLPADELAACGLEARDLLDPGAQARLSPVLERWERRALRGLLAGLVYTVRLPRGAWSLRTATALPAAIGLATLRRLSRSDRRLDPSLTIRVTRPELRGIVLRTALVSARRRGPLRLSGALRRG